jgi:hypothetical protein
MTDLPTDWADYYAAKGRDLPTLPPAPQAQLLQNLDAATSWALNYAGKWTAVEAAFEAVLAAPGSTWTRETLSFRQRQLYFK